MQRGLSRNTIRIYIARYEWDERKNRENWRKHGVSFELAIQVFEDEDCLIDLDRVDSSGEQRWHAIGLSHMQGERGLLLLVVHAYRENIDGEEITRIISARKAAKRDVRRYQEQEVE